MAIIPSFGLGSFFQIAVLLVNAVAILSEDRFLARIGLSSATHDPAFGAGQGGDQSFQYKLMNMIASVRMVTRSESLPGTGGSCLAAGSDRKANESTAQFLWF